MEEALRPYLKDITEQPPSQTQPPPPSQNQCTHTTMVNQNRKQTTSSEEQWPTRCVDWMDYFPIEDNPHQLMADFIPEDNVDMFTPNFTSNKSTLPSSV